MLRSNCSEVPPIWSTPLKNVLQVPLQNSMFSIYHKYLPIVNCAKCLNLSLFSAVCLYILKPIRLHSATIMVNLFKTYWHILYAKINFRIRQYICMPQFFQLLFSYQRYLITTKSGFKIEKKSKTKKGVNAKQRYNDNV